MEKEKGGVHCPGPALFLVDESEGYLEEVTYNIYVYYYYYNVTGLLDKF
jgi:hypothetical protein